jgi:hypothetical protein
LSFDGISDRVYCGNDASLKPTTELTLEAWVKFDTSYGRDMIICDNDYRNQHRSYYLGRHTAPDTLVFGVSDDGLEYYVIQYNPVNTNDKVVSDTWYHVTATFDGNTQESKLYIDGLEVPTSIWRGSPISSLHTSPSPIFIGAGIWQDQWNFDGTIDEVAVYSRALTSGEVLQHYNDGIAGIPVAPDISTGGLWHFDEGSGKIAIDSSNNNNHADLYTLLPHLDLNSGYSTTENLGNYYDMFVKPGDWFVREVELNFGHYNPEYNSWSQLRINHGPSSVHYGPYLAIEPGETVQHDLNYETGQIVARLKVATGEPLSRPNVWGNKNYLEAGEPQAWVGGGTSAAGVTEGLVPLILIPGKYTLFAEAKVMGSTTTFGKINVVVGPGDIIELDPNAPLVNIITPTGNYETTESSVTVTGTVTDDSEITSFTINGNSVSIAEDDSFSTVICGLVTGENVIEVYAQDEHGNSVTIERTVIVLNTPPTADIGGPYTTSEGTEITLDASGSSDQDGDTLQYRWDLENDGVWDTDYSTNPTVPYTWDNDYTGTVAVEVYDGHVSSTTTTTLTVLNTDPVITSITATIDPTPVGYSVDLSAGFTDDGIYDTHTSVINWGDDTTSVGTVNEAGGSGTISGNHIYTTPGVYTITVSITDDDGASVSDEYRYVVVYDPTGSFITGGGHIYSPSGAYIPDQSLSGKATFGFVCKYKNGATSPDGNTQFQFHAGDLSFHSTDYDWLVVAGKKGMFKGTGTINGEGNYGFILSAIDGDLQDGDGVDKFRIMIWDKVTEQLVYDNNLGAVDDADPTTALTHGSIKIHKA